MRGWLRGCYASLSGDTMPPEGASHVFYIPPGARMRDRFVSGELPGWLSDDDLDVYVDDLAAYDGAVITQPSLFIGGALDASAAWFQNVIDSFSTTMPGLVSSHLLAGCGHWVQEERPAHVNELLINWLHRVYPATA